MTIHSGCGGGEEELNELNSWRTFTCSEVWMVWNCQQCEKIPKSLKVEIAGIEMVTPKK